MEAVIFVGLQASGKSSFYRERFFRTHLRINLDMLKTRHREKRFLDVCLETSLPFVIDNTNPSIADREPYITAAKAKGYRIACYYFQSKIEDCKRRNAARPENEQVPLPGILGTSSRLQIPSRSEGFDMIQYVRINDAGGFLVEEWNDEV
jgi:predicted kinase